MPATAKTINFTKTPDVKVKPIGRYIGGPIKPRTSDGKLLTPKQIRARMRRKAAKAEILTDQEMAHLYQKPIEEWDLEELAAGRPKPFRGPKPKWINAAVHERSMELYQQAIRSGMRGLTVGALTALEMLMTSEDTDEKGKPIVPAGVKADISKFLLEHTVGKPTQRVENDVSVKLQGILGAVMVNPNQVNPQQYTPAHFPGITMKLANSEGDEDYDGSDA